MRQLGDWFDFDESCREATLNRFLYPVNSMKASKPWLFINNEDDLHLLYHVVTGISLQEDDIQIKADTVP